MGCTSRRRCAERITQARKTSKPRSPWRVRRTSNLQWTPVDWRGTGREHGRAARVADDGPRQRPALQRRALELPRILTCPSRGDSPPASPTGVLLRELTNLVSDHLYGQCRSADRHPWLSDMPGEPHSDRTECESGHLGQPSPSVWLPSPPFGSNRGQEAGPRRRQGASRAGCPDINSTKLESASE